MAFRDERDALYQRVVSLERQLAAAQASADESEELKARLAKAQAELARLKPKCREQRIWFCWSRQFPIGIGGLLLLVLFFTPLFGSLSASCGGYKAFLVQSLEACPRAQELLGEDISISYTRLGCGTGSTETEGGTGHASWALPFAGDRAGGTLSFDLEKHGGKWMMTRGVLDVNDGSVNDQVDVHACITRRNETPEKMIQTTAARCAGGDAGACLTVGAIYEKGHGVVADAKRAVEFYQKACDLGLKAGCRFANPQAEEMPP